MLNIIMALKKSILLLSLINRTINIVFSGYLLNIGLVYVQTKFVHILIIELIDENKVFINCTI